MTNYGNRLIREKPKYPTITNECSIIITADKDNKDVILEIIDYYKKINPLIHNGLHITQRENPLA